MLKSTRRWIIATLFLAVISTIGCQAGGKSSGKYSNLDKPKPAEGQK
jgi:hypothetical protein